MGLFGEATVANIKSAMKRIQITERNRLRNKSYKSAIKTLTKHYLAAVSAYAAQPTDENKAAVSSALSTVYSKIDKGVKCGALHANTGSRKKARLSQVFKRATASLAS